MTSADSVSRATRLFRWAMVDEFRRRSKRGKCLAEDVACPVPETDAVASRRSLVVSSPLTPRQAQLVDVIVERRPGSAAEVARWLGIRRQSVDVMLRAIRCKVREPRGSAEPGVEATRHTRPEATRRALQSLEPTRRRRATRAEHPLAARRA